MKMLNELLDVINWDSLIEEILLLGMLDTDSLDVYPLLDTAVATGDQVRFDRLLALAIRCDLLNVEKLQELLIKAATTPDLSKEQLPIVRHMISALMNAGADPNHATLDPRSTPLLKWLRMYQLSFDESVDAELAQRRLRIITLLETGNDEAEEEVEETAVVSLENTTERRASEPLEIFRFVFGATSGSSI